MKTIARRVETFALLFLFAVLSFAFVAVPQLQDAHATSGVESRQYHQDLVTAPSTLSITLPSNSSSGDIVVVFCAIYSGFAVNHTISSVTGGSLTWTLRGSIGHFSTSEPDYQATTTVSTAIAPGGSFTATCNFPQANYVGMAAYDIQGYTVSGIVQARGYATTNNSPTTNTITPAAGDFVAAMGVGILYTGSGSLAQGTGFSPNWGSVTPGMPTEYIASWSGTTTDFPWNSFFGNYGFVEIGIDIPLSSSSMTLECQLKESGATTETGTLSGASVSPTNPSCSSAGASTSITCTPSGTITFTVASDNPTTRYRFNSSATSSTTQTFTCTGSSTVQLYNYYQLSNDYSMQPVSPIIWDGNYMENAVGTYAGAGSSTICTISLVVGTGGSPFCGGFADYNLNICTPASFSSSVAGTWTSFGTHCWSFTTGGNEDYAQYNLTDSITEKVTITPANSAPSDTATISGCDTSSSTIAMDGVQHTFAADASCVLTITVPSDSTDVRYRFPGLNTSVSYTTSSSGTDTKAFTVYLQYGNTYTLKPGIPSIWDYAYSEPLTGFFLGSSTTLGSFTQAMGGGSSSLSRYADYGTTVHTPSSWAALGGSGGSWSAQNSSSFTNTVHGQFFTTTYDIIIANGIHIKITQNEAGPAQTFYISGCGISPTSTTGDGVNRAFNSSFSCVAVVFNTDNSTARIRFSNGMSTETFTSVPNGNYSFTYDYQLNVTMATNNPGVSTTTPAPGTYWADYGIPFLITADISYNSASLPEGLFVSWLHTGTIALGSSTNYITNAIATTAGTITANIDTIHYVVQQPNPLTIQFWVFPIILVVYYMLEFLVIPMRAGATTWARNYSMFTGLVVGSIVALSTQTLEFFALLLFVIVWALYAFRG